MKSRQLVPWRGMEPKLEGHNYLAPGAYLIGAVHLGQNTSVWYNAVVRADLASIEFGNACNIQDGVVIHVSRTAGVKCGNNVTLGHLAILHSCTLGNNVLVGMHATVLDGVEIGDFCILGAGTVVSPGTKVPSGSLVLGVPGRVVRSLTDAERDKIQESAKHYQDLASEALEQAL